MDTSDVGARYGWIWGVDQAKGNAGRASTQSVSPAAANSPGTGIQQGDETLFPVGGDRKEQSK